MNQIYSFQGEFIIYQIPTDDIWSSLLINWGLHTNTNVIINTVLQMCICINASFRNGGPRFMMGVQFHRDNIN